MHSPTLDDLAARLEKVERQNRRLKRFGVVSLALFLLLVGVLSYQGLINIWRPGTFTQSISLYNGKPLSFAEMTRLALGGAVIMDDDRGFRGNIGTHKSDDGNRTTDYTGLYFVNDEWHEAFLSVSERGALLRLEDSTNAVFLGPGLYDGQPLLELISQDGQQGIRLGLDGNQQPLFEVIRDGEAASLLASTGSQPLAPVRDAAHQ